MHGEYGTATEVLFTPSIPDQQASIRTWLLNCPGQSPFWSHYMLSILHLREIDGALPVTILFPGATHQVIVMALDTYASPTPDNIEEWVWLTPVNVQEQLELPSDQAAGELLDLCAAAVIEGVLPAEPALSGDPEPWRSALLKSAAHLRGEAHAP